MPKVEWERLPNRKRRDQVEIGPDYGPSIASFRIAQGKTRTDFIGEGREDNLAQIELRRRRQITKSLAQELERLTGISPDGTTQRHLEKRPQKAFEN